MHDGCCALGVGGRLCDREGPAGGVDHRCRDPLGGRAVAQDGGWTMTACAEGGDYSASAG